MHEYLPITDVYAREILDSRGNPTIEVEVLAGERKVGRAAVPSGASTGKYEAVELRDKEKRYQGKGVQRAVEHVNQKLAQELIGANVFDQIRIDAILKKADGSENKANLGANALLGVSLAAAKAGANARNQPLFRYLSGVRSMRMPVPMMNILNGGAHADNTLDIQEFMIMPVGACCFREGLRMCTEIYHELKALLHTHGLNTSVGDEGGFAPDLPNAKEALKFIADAVRAAGYELERDIVFAMDVAASELYDRDFKKYVFPGESRMQGHQVVRSVEELIDYYEDLASEFPIRSIEDPLDEEDFEGWELLTTRLGNDLQLVGDDLFVTNIARLQQGIDRAAANAILIKVNQIGTLTEAIEAIELAKSAGYQTIISHRSGETEDTFIADLAVAVNAGQIKTGAPCRGERTAKYNQLLRIEEKLGEMARYENPFLGFGER
ncbi:phosphopyruvate hydratase [Hespellia stercorisuis]|uniref:Enolase n=1 Tax=Hespellia stercorisuis DSM 15480 TaxID=1121950 RepID=A0A1M6LC72_9FIRM|nr:phosphopyruvate hydratase [Hespellia stercorisuis]SHJ68769.1 enolase [Hespellia stercorisuis DSM 15480]